jgi:hypothetical protein
VGAVAYGSVLLASVPPASMYMKPTFPAVGACLPIQAFAQSIAAASMHIGSGPGRGRVVGHAGESVVAFAQRAHAALGVRRDDRGVVRDLRRRGKHRAIDELGIGGCGGGFRLLGGRRQEGNEGECRGKRGE